MVSHHSKMQKDPKKSNSMQGVKSAKLEIANLALLIPCMEFEISWVQIPSFEVFGMCH